MLIDEVQITAIAGNGGNGSSSLQHDSITSRGGPDGGNGGNGGNIYFIGVTDLSALSVFRYKKVVKAKHGENGGRQNKYGKNAEDLYVNVPVGTRITEVKSGRSYEISDTTSPILVARGGAGGKGNKELTTAFQGSARNAETGSTGQVKELLLELLIIADIGLIGFPNAGKSSILSVLTNATPKIGNYPFTTLEPNIGVLFKDNYEEDKKSITIADIPGVIEGASTGKGLGLKFLKHIEKTKLLLHCLDVTEEELLGKYYAIRDELKNYNENMLDKDEKIVLTKTDLIDSETLKSKISKLKKLKKEMLTISIYEPEQIDNLKVYLKNYFA